MPDNLIKGNFTTLTTSSIREENGVTKGGYIDMNYNGVVELHGKELYINFREGIELRNDGSLILNSTGGDLLFNSEICFLHILQHPFCCKNNSSYCFKLIPYALIKS